MKSKLIAFVFTSTFANFNLSNLLLQLTVKKDVEKANSFLAHMEITEVRVEDAGKYKVIAKNELGESNASISLNFDSK